MSSAGHVQNMISTMKRNRAALKSKQAKFRGKKIFNIKYDKSGQVIPEKKISFEEMKLIKEEIRKEAKADRINKIKKVTVIVILILIPFSILINKFIHYLL